MTWHTEKFQRMRLAVENVITAILMIPNNHNASLILKLFITFLKDSLFDYAKLAHMAVIYFI